MVRRGQADDIDAGSIVLGDAFHNYAWTRWIVDGDDHVRRVTALQRLALEYYAIPFGQMWVATVSQAVHCVAVWMDSAVEVPASVHAGIEQRTAELQGARQEAAVDATRQIPDWRPAEHHWVLEAIGTTSSMQGQGFASRTLAPTLASLDERGIPAFLETSSRSNVGFYERHGFAVAGHQRIAPDGPDVWAMTRPARELAGPSPC